MPLRILYLDLNSYFASVEQQLHPELRGKPLAVVPMVSDRTVVIAASVEAKRFGVRTGTNVGDARRMCPELLLVRGNHEEYIRVHHEVLAAVDACIPVDRVCSIDEVSCRLAPAEQAPEAAQTLARRVKASIRTRVGECVTCSIGLAPNRLLGKIASDMQKPDGLVTLTDADLPSALYRLDLIDLPGVGKKMRQRLTDFGIKSVEDLCSRSKADMVSAWGSVVGAFWYRWLRGEETPDAPTPTRSIGHQHVLGPERRTPDGARAVAIRLLTKAAARARRKGYLAGAVQVAVRFLGQKSWERNIKLGSPCSDTLTLVAAIAAAWTQCPSGRPFKVSVTLVDLQREADATLPLYDGQRNDRKLGQAIDRLNAKYGRNAVYPASMHETKSTASTRIAFRNIPDLNSRD